MKLLVKPSRIHGSIAVTGSKSHTIRGIVAALMTDGVSILYSPLESADTRSTLEVAKQFGAKVKEFPDRWEITGTGGKFTDPGQIVNLGNSGTGLRMLTALAALQHFRIGFDGDSSLRTRLMSGLLGALEALGANVETVNGKCPLFIQGPIRGGTTSVDGTTSQFLTSLLFALPNAEGDSKVKLESLNEKPYINITLSWLDAFGIRYRKSEDMLFWEIPGKQHIPPFKRVIPADFSTATFPLVAAALVGDGIEIRNLDFNDAQGDKHVFDLLENMGAKIERGKPLCVLASSKLSGRKLDLNSTPDALPILAVAATLADGETHLANVPQARVKETDRIAAMNMELTKMGADIQELPDGMIIRGGKLHGAEVDSHADHRIAMALAVAALAAEGETIIHNAEAASVTYPDFVRDFQALNANFTILD